MSAGLCYHGARTKDQSVHITLQLDFDEGVNRITLAPQDVTGVLLSLFNSFYAARKRHNTEAAPGFESALKVVTREQGDMVDIKVDGIGIPEEVKDELF